MLSETSQPYWYPSVAMSLPQKSLCACEFISHSDVLIISGKPEIDRLPYLERLHCYRFHSIMLSGQHNNQSLMLKLNSGLSLSQVLHLGEEKLTR